MFNKAVIQDCVLYHGDCFEVLPEITDADCLITDPPYGCTSNEWDKKIDLEKFWEYGKSACKADASFIIFCQMPFMVELYLSNPKDFKYDLVYVKPKPSNMLNAKRQPMRGHENILVFCSGKTIYNPQKIKKRPKKFPINNPQGSCYTSNLQPIYYDNPTGEVYPTTIIDPKHEVDFYNAKLWYKRHPTQKSVAALEWLVKTYSNNRDVILDPFMGSGSTGVAAVKTGRKFIGVEQDLKWFDVACQRIEAEYQNNSLYNIERAQC